MSYLNLHQETERAKQRLAQVFEEQQTETGNRAIEDLTGHSEKATEPRWLSADLTRPAKADSRKKGSSQNESTSAGRDMSTSSFVLTILLSGTIAAANTDQPLFWLSIGPAPLAAALAAIILFRLRLTPNSR
jgi:hypothetical protein